MKVLYILWVFFTHILRPIGVHAFTLIRSCHRGGGGDNKGWGIGKGRQETCVKDTRTKPKGDRIKGGRWGGWGGGSGRGKTETTVLEQQLKKRKRKKLLVKMEDKLI